MDKLIIPSLRLSDLHRARVGGDHRRLDGGDNDGRAGRDWHWNDRGRRGNGGLGSRHNRRDLGDRADGGVSRDRDGSQDGRLSRAIGDDGRTAGNGEGVRGVHGRGGVVAGGVVVGGDGSGQSSEDDGVLHFAEFVGLMILDIERFEVGDKRD